MSTTKEATGGVSLEAQREAITRWCAANGYELVELYVDAGVSPLASLRLGARSPSESG